MTTPIIAADELAKECAGDSPPVLLDVRWRLAGPPGIDSYRAGHLPGAVFVDLDRELSGPPGPGRAASDARCCGVPGGDAPLRGERGRDVVAYDDGDPVAAGAARAWWLLRYSGHSRVRVLDGGYRTWMVEGRPITVETGTSEPGDFVARPGGMPVLDAGQVRHLARAGLLLDARVPERYRGEIEPVDRVAGHIPGAVSAPVTANVDTEGRFRSPAWLRERFDALGDGGGLPVGVYCGSGVTAAHGVLALELADIPAALYVGSWSNWISDQSRPVATGAQPG